eukprot:1668128-Pleurochrysis_carterae.AAC.1
MAWRAGAILQFSLCMFMRVGACRKAASLASKTLRASACGSAARNRRPCLSQLHALRAAARRTVAAPAFHPCTLLRAAARRT